MRDIRLPELTSIHVKDYSLYAQKSTFSYNFKGGINAILGINGIGKTTFIEMILYSLVGFPLEVNETKKTGVVKSHKQNISYFKNRCDLTKNNENATVTLKYKLRDTNILIERSLIDDKILHLEFDGVKSESKEDDYNKKIAKMMGISDIVSVQKIIRTFLVFDEQRLNVAWEVTTQDEILKILLLDEDVQLEISELERSVSALDTEGRHKSEDRRIIRDRIKVLEEERKKISDNFDECISKDENDEWDYQELLAMKNIIKADLEEFAQQLLECKEDLKNLQTKYSTILGERNYANQRIENIISEEEKIEVELYKSIYEQFPDYYFTLEKNLINEGECLACGEKNSTLKLDFITRKKQHRCLICGSKLNISNTFNDSESIEVMNKLYDEKVNLSNLTENKTEILNKLKNEIEAKEYDIKEICNYIDRKEASIIEVESRLVDNQSEPPKDTFDIMVRNLDLEAEKLTKEIEGIYEKRDQSKFKLEIKQREFYNFISSLNKNISSYFNKYASAFLGVDCELTIKQQTIRFIPHIKFMPKIAGFERESIYSVSESQRFFLDQAFRMAIIDFLSSEIAGFKTFFITETPEGSLDLAYEEQVAKMFVMFARSNNNIIFTSNLNSSNFLKKIFRQTRDVTSRILNMLEIGRKTDIQKDYEKMFENKLFEIQGKEEGE